MTPKKPVNLDAEYDQKLSLGALSAVARRELEDAFKEKLVATRRRVRRVIKDAIQGGYTSVRFDVEGGTWFFFLDSLEADAEVFETHIVPELQAEGIKVSFGRRRYFFGLLKGDRYCVIDWREAPILPAQSPFPSILKDPDPA